MDQVRRSELLPLEAIGRSEIVAAITKETDVLTQASQMLAFAGQGAVLVVFVAMYIAYLSFLAFVLSAIILGAVADCSMPRADSSPPGPRGRRLGEPAVRTADGPSRRVQGGAAQPARSDELYADIVEVSGTAANIKIRTQSETFKQVGVHAELGLSPARRHRVRRSAPSATPPGLPSRRSTTALMFVVGVCFGLVQTIPVLTAANAAAENIEQLEATIAGDRCGGARRRRSQASLSTRSRCATSSSAMSTGSRMQCSRSDRSISPCTPAISCSSPAATVPGKSTFLKLLAGLYQPDSGEIMLDGVRINDNTRESYRALIAAIFADYHLFQRLYGIADPDPPRSIGC